MKNFIAPDCGVSCPEKKEKTTFSDKSEELITTFKSSENPMAERIFSMADLVCLLREEIQSLLEDSRLVSVVKILPYWFSGFTNQAENLLCKRHEGRERGT